MKEFNVTIIETLKRTVTVEAETAEDAKDMVDAAWHTSEYILEAEDFDGVEFTIQDDKNEADTDNEREFGIGDELRDDETNTNAVIVGMYEDHCECIAFNGNDFDTLSIPKTELYLWDKTGRNFSQIAEMIEEINVENKSIDTSKDRPYDSLYDMYYDEFDDYEK